MDAGRDRKVVTPVLIVQDPRDGRVVDIGLDPNTRLIEDLREKGDEIEALVAFGRMKAFLGRAIEWIDREIERLETNRGA